MCYLLDHFLKLFSLVLSQVLVVFNIRDIQLVLGLWLRGLKRAGENGNFHVAQFL